MLVVLHLLPVDQLYEPCEGLLGGEDGGLEPAAGLPRQEPAQGVLVPANRFSAAFAVTFSTVVPGAKNFSVLF